MNFEEKIKKKYLYSTGLNLIKILYFYIQKLKAKKFIKKSYSGGAQDLIINYFFKNKKFKKINFPTNILSFHAARNINADNFLNNNDDNFLGDIVISSDTLIKEANSEKKKPIDHLIHLFIHGVLHLLGYDHKNSYEAKIMEALEVKILKNLNISDPYLDNT